MKKANILLILLMLVMASCSYDEDINVVPVSVRLEFPDSYTDSKDGLRVELQDATASVFVDTTDVQGVAHFTVPSGLYTARSSARKTTANYRYFFNGTRDKIVIASDSSRVIDLKLTMSRKRIIR